MSSTNRGYNRHKKDYYITPLQPIRDFIYQWIVDEEIERPDRLMWLDPCAGGDKNNQMSYPTIIKEEFDPTIMTIDIREDSKAEIKADYLMEKIIEPKPNIIITNPPFFLAQEIIEKALEDVADGGYVVMLLRLNFFGSKARKPFWDKQMPTRAYIHNRRLSFTDDGKTDSIEYMHAVWQKGIYPKFTKLSII